MFPLTLLSLVSHQYDKNLTVNSVEKSTTNETGNHHELVLGALIVAGLLALALFVIIFSYFKSRIQLCRYRDNKEEETQQYVAINNNYDSSQLNKSNLNKALEHPDSNNNNSASDLESVSISSCKQWPCATWDKEYKISIPGCEINRTILSPFPLRIESQYLDANEVQVLIIDKYCKDNNLIRLDTTNVGAGSKLHSWFDDKEHSCKHQSTHHNNSFEKALNMTQIRSVGPIPTFDSNDNSSSNISSLSTSQCDSMSSSSDYSDSCSENSEEILVESHLTHRIVHPVRGLSAVSNKSIATTRCASKEVQSAVESTPSDEFISNRGTSAPLQIHKSHSKPHLKRNISVSSLFNVNLQYSRSNSSASSSGSNNYHKQPYILQMIKKPPFILERKQSLRFVYGR
jgi:hypothetical protein